MERFKVKHWKPNSYSSGNTAMESLRRDWDFPLNEFESEWVFRMQA